jgi:hypothetical protein
VEAGGVDGTGVEELVLLGAEMTVPLPTVAMFGMTKNDRLRSASSPPLYRHDCDVVSYKNPQQTMLSSHFR